jgi:hypothetical protein
VPEVELLYVPDCPNIAAARTNLMRAFTEAGMTPKWSEREIVAAPGAPGAYASPTILVDGRDVAGDQPYDAASCRLYVDAQGQVTGAPAVATITAALRAARPVTVAVRPGAAGVAGALPAVGVALLPKLTCAACWPAYAALLGAFGVSFVDYTPYLLPVTALLLGATLWLIGRRARSRRGYGPLALATAAAAVVLLGKFYFDSDAAAWAGTAPLVAASLWNAWPRRGAAPCPQCAACETATQNP